MLLTVFSLFTRAIGFFYHIWLSREVGAEVLGLYQIASSVFALLVTLTSSGIPVTVSRFTARAGKRNSKAAQDATVTAATFLTLCVSGAISLLLLVFRDNLSFLFADNRCQFIFLALLPAFAASSVYSSVRGGLWGKRNYLSYALVELFEEVAIVVAGFLLLSGVDTVFGKAVSMAHAVSIAYVASALLSVILYFVRGGRFRRFSGQTLPLLKSAAPVTAVRLCSCLLNSLIAILLPARLCRGGIAMSEALSLFGVASGMTLPLLFMPSAFTGSISLVLVPEISQMTHSGEQKKLTTSIDEAINFCLMVAAVALPAYIAVGRDFGFALYHNEQAGRLLALSAVTMLPLSIQGISSTVLNSLGREYRALINFGISAVVYLVIIIVLPVYIGIMGMIVGIFAHVTISCILNLISIRKCVKIKGKCFFSLLKMLPAGILTGGIGYFTNELLKRILPLFYASCLALGICIALMLLFAVTAGTLDFKRFGIRLPKIGGRSRKKEATHSFTV